MSTTFRVVVHCDHRRGHECLGFFEASSKDLRGVDRVGAALEAHGWWRGYTADDTHDVCPACRPAFEREREEGR